MKSVSRLETILFLAPLLAQANSLAIPFSSSSITVKVPNRTPFNSLNESRVEFRLHSFTWSAGKQILALGGAALFFSGPAYQFSAGQQICARNDAQDDMHTYGGVACVDVTGRSDVIVRVQRAVTQFPQGEWRLEIWDTTGGGYAQSSCAPGNAPCPISRINNTDFHGTTALTVAPQATGAIAWIKWWSSSVPLNSGAPKISDTSDLGNWILDNTLTDQSSWGLNLSFSKPVYIFTPIYPPVCSIVNTALNARGTSTLQSTSYPLDGGTSLTHAWITLDGPSTPSFSDASVPNPTIGNLAYGAYTIQLTVTDSSSQSSICNLPMAAIGDYSNNVVDAGHPPAGAILYWLDNTIEPLRSSIMNYYASRVSVAIGSNQNMAVACTAAGYSCLWPVYVDQSIFTPDGQYSRGSESATLGLDMESILNHMKVDYSIPAAAGHGPAGNLDFGQFDLFENNSGAGARYGASSKGAFLVNGAAYTDVTVSAYDGSSPQPISDKLLLGYALPFSQVNVILNTSRSGGSVQWQYWNGAWANLAPATDGTSGLIQNGQINFVPPADWTTHSENSSQPKYWLRAVLSRPSTPPVYKRVWGDEWVQTPTVFTLAGTVYKDVSFNIHHGFANTSVSDKLLIGFPSTRVAEIDWRIATPASGGTVSYQYWNGTAYVAFAGLADGSAGLTTSGMTSWTVPADWALHAENGVSAYWIRVTVVGAPASPMISTVWSKTALRGWSYTDPHRIHQGLGNLEYNPTPPAGSQATFRYQARLNSATWLHNYFMFNPSNQQNGKYSVAELIGSEIIHYATAASAAAVMLDDANAVPQMVSPAYNGYLANSDWGGSTYLDSQLAVLNAEKQKVHAAMGSGFAVAANSEVMTYNWNLDASLSENFANSYFLGNMRYNLTADPTALDVSSSMDAFLPENNPNGAKGWILMRDTVWDGGLQMADGNWYPWDRANRGPMAALAGYHMASSVNTVFMYNSRNEYYYETDQFYIRNPISAKLTSSVMKDLSTNLKTIAVSDTSLLHGGTPWVGNCGGAPPIGNISLGSQLICLNAVLDATHIQTTSPINANYDAGTRVAAILEKRQSVDPVPPLSEVYAWGVSFPAMWADIGVPDPAGYNGGKRHEAWKLGAAITGLPDSCQGSGCPNVWRRDFTKALILTRPFHVDSPAIYSNDPRELNVPSVPIDLGGTYYQLLADGNTGPAITSIQMRAAEGVILLKTPRTQPAAAGQTPSRLRVQPRR